MSPDSNVVLVVDDDRMLARTVCDILQLNGYDSVAANTGSGGLEIAAARSKTLPVALVDLRLPDMDGMELVTRLREVAELTQVVILTGNASLDSAVEALRKNSCDYLVKPVAPEQLVATVKRGFQRWHHRSAEEDLRRDRERFQLLVEALSDVITVVTPDGLVQYQSPSALRMLGYGPGALAGTPFIEHVLPRDRARVADGVSVAADSPGRERAFEFHFRKADGSWCLLEGVARTLHDRRDAPVVVTCRDITERRRLEEELQQTQKMESIGRLAGGVAHDFNNQLTAIMSAADMAQWEENVPEAVVEELSEIRLAAQRAARLTRQLLIFSRKDVTEPRRVDVNEVVGSMESMLRRLVPAHVRIVTDLGDDLPPVLVDPTQLEQVLLNLVVNARDAMGRQGGRASVRTRLRRRGTVDEEGGEPAAEDMVVLEVADEGTGISEEVMGRIFEPFFTTKERGRGTGLGLATCYGIVTRAGGIIRARSRPGVGTTFQVLLPARPGPTEPARAAEPRRRPRQGDEVVLLVEDDDAVRRGLSRLLERDGYRVLTAASGEEALGMIPDGPLHLLVTDLVMPGMSGREVAEAVVARRPDTAVLFTSGYADTDIIGEAALPFGADLLRKPVEAGELLERVAEALEGGGER